MVNRSYIPTDRRLPAELSRMRQSIEDAQRPTGTERERSLLRLQEAVNELETQQAALEELVKRLPQSEGRDVSATSWAISGSWSTILTITIPKPEDKTRVVVSANASVLAPD